MNNVKIFSLMRRLAFLAWVLIFSTSLTPMARAEEPVKKIVYLSDGELSYFSQLSVQVRKELAALAEGKYQAEFLKDQHAGWDAEKARELLRGALTDEAVDLILVSGMNMTLAVAGSLPLSKPVIISGFSDPGLLGLPRSAENTSGVKNLCYIAKTQGAGADFAAFRRMVRFKTLHILLDPTQQPYADLVLAKIGKKDFQTKLLPVTGTAAEILAQLDQDQVEAVYLAPLRLSEEQLRMLTEGINQRKIPSFTALGSDQVERGVLAGRIPKFMTKFSRRVALNADRILSGEDAGTLPVEFELEDKMVINQKTADQIGLSVPFDVLLNAEVLFSAEATGGGDVLTLKEAVKRSLANNLNFRIIDEQIKIANKSHWLAWTQYLPKIDFRTDYRINDSEQAHNNAGTSKWDYEYGISMNQLLFSHPVFFDIANTKKQIKIEKLRSDTASLDITNQTVLAYLSYLNAKALHKVEQENLKAIEVNLEVAKKRQQTGAGGPEEVLRWESQYAQKKSEVLQREAGIYQSRVDLNQLMNQPMEALFLEEDIGLETVQHYIGSQYMAPYVRNFKSLQMFLEFAAREALTDSPELQALDVGIEIQRNKVRSADGQFFLPTASLNGEVAHEIKEKNYEPQPKDSEDDWGMNLRLSFPLFDRGRRPIESLQRRDELHLLQFSKELKNQDIERRLRRAVYDIYASLPSIELKRQAMESSSKNYDIVERKYNEGLVNITELIDAQTDKFNRQSQAVTAIYDFLTNLSNFDRQLAAFHMLATEEEQQAWLEKLQQYLEQNGMI